MHPPSELCVNQEAGEQRPLYPPGTRLTPSPMKNRIRKSASPASNDYLSRSDAVLRAFFSFFCFVVNFGWLDLALPFFCSLLAIGKFSQYVLEAKATGSVQ